MWFESFVVPPSTLPGYEFTHHYADLGGMRMHYLDEGRGETVVMLHGNPNWSYYYRNLVVALRDRYRCLVPDHIGCGMSDKPDERRYEFSLAQRVADLEHWLDKLQAVRDLTLIVHDWGGMIGMAYATKHPDRIKRLVVLNTGAFHLPATKPVPWQLKLARSPFGALLVRGFGTFSRGAVQSCVTRRPMPGEPTARRMTRGPTDSLSIALCRTSRSSRETEATTLSLKSATTLRS